MPVSDVFLEKPDASKIITLKAAAWGFTLKSGAEVQPLDQKDTIGIDLGLRTRVFTVIGKLTIASRVGLEDLEDAALNWNIGDLQARLELGKKSNGTPYDFKVFISSLTIDWNSEEPGGSDASGTRILRYTLLFNEVGVIGALN